MPATSGDISLEGFLSSLYINLTVFVVIVLLFTLFRQCVPQFYQPRLYSVDDKGAAFRLELPGKPNVRRQKRYERQLNRRNAATYAPLRHDDQGPPLIPEKWYGFYWIVFVWNIPLETVLKTVGLDAYMFLRFAQRVAQLFGIVCLILGFAVLVPVNLEFGTPTEDAHFDSLSLAFLGAYDPVLWLHAASVWMFTFATFAVLLELEREFTMLRHRYLRYNFYHRTSIVPSSIHAEPNSENEQNQKVNVATDESHTMQETKQAGISTEVSQVPPWTKNPEGPDRKDAFHVANPRPYTVMVETLPSWVNCDAHLYFFFDFLFPGEVYAASLVTNAFKADEAWERRNAILKKLEHADHLERKQIEGSSSFVPTDGSMTTDIEREVGLVDEDVKFNKSDRSVTMVLCPSSIQWFLNWFCCGPFFSTLCCGCYRRICQCCDDHGRHEEEALDRLELAMGEESNTDEEEGKPRPRTRALTGPVIDSMESKCCGRQPYRVRAKVYFERMLAAQTRKLNSFRKRARNQFKRRYSSEFIAPDREIPLEITHDMHTSLHSNSLGTDHEAEIAASGVTNVSKRVCNADAEPIESQSREKNADNSGSRENIATDKAPLDVPEENAHTNGAPKKLRFSKQIAKAARGVYDRLAYTTEVLTGFELRHQRQSKKVDGFRPSSTGFVTFRNISAVSAASQLSIVPERASRDPTISSANAAHLNNLASEGQQQKLSFFWTDKQAIQLIKEATTEILSPFRAILEVLDIVRYRGITVTRAPGKEDLIWSHLSVKEEWRSSRRWTTFWITVALGITYFLLITVVSALVSVNNLSEILPGLETLLYRSSFVRGVITGWFPVALMETLLSVLPPVFMFLSYLEFPRAWSELAFATATKFFLFKAWQLMFSFAISGAVLDSLASIIDEPGDVLGLLGSSLPNLSSFYTNLLMFQALIMIPMQMLRPFPMIMHYIKFRMGLFVSRSSHIAKQPSERNISANSRKTARYNQHTWQLWDMTRREYWEHILLSGGEFHWSRNFTNVLLGFLIGITYSSINPVISPIAAAFFLLVLFVWKYQFLYVHHKRWETGGLILPKIVRRVNVSLVAYQVTMFAILGLKQSESLFILPPLMVITYAFNLFLRKRLENAAMNLSKEEAQEIDVDNSGFRDKSMRKAAFHSLHEIEQTNFSGNARKACAYSSYIRPSLDPRQDWNPHKLPTDIILYY